MGASIWQTPGGVQDEIDKINGDFELFGHALDAELARMGPRPYATKSAQDLADLHDHTWAPLLQHWQAWYAQNRGWWDNFWWNHAPTAEMYQKQLIEVRDQANRIGVAIRSPAPSSFGPSALFDPSHNLFDDAAGAARQLTDLPKLAIAAACVLGGVLILGQIGK